MDKSQAWFWTPEWQRMETEADEDLRLGRYEAFDSMEELIESLKRPSAALQAAMYELESGGGQRFATVEEMFAEWNTPEEDEAWAHLGELAESKV